MRNNPFEVHGIQHLSASAINQFITNPASWILKVSGHKGISNPAMWRGTAVDDAIGTAFDYKLDIKSEEILKQSSHNALAIFDNLFDYYKKNNEYDIEKVNAERNNIKRYMEAAIPFYEKLGKPQEVQKRIEVEFEDIPVPIIGYIDLQYKGVIRDIKTTGRLMSTVPSTICRQLSLYAYAEDSIPYADFIHVTKAKAEVVSIEITDVDKRVNELRQAALSMMNVLSYSDDINQVATLFYPDFDDWRWSNPVDRDAAKKLWRIE